MNQRLVVRQSSMIRSITERTGAKIEIQDDGRVDIASSDEHAAQRAIEIIKELTAEAELGKVYLGKVVRVVNFGAFVEILPGVEGLLHISEIDWHRIDKVEDVCQEGDTMKVKVLEIDKANGKIRLSRKELLEKPENLPERESAPRTSRPPRNSGRDQGKGRSGGGRGRDGDRKSDRRGPPRNGTR